jgi:hypothetical protein
LSRTLKRARYVQPKNALAAAKEFLDEIARFETE